MSATGDESAPRAGLTHLDGKGDARMVDVGGKDDTRRRAVASAVLYMRSETLAMIVEGRGAKGDVFAAARIAGIMAAKRTSGLIPLCHPVALTHAHVDLAAVRPSAEEGAGRAAVRITATCETTGPTGVEMEALTAAAVAGLTLYDMCKAVDRGMVMGDVMLIEKDGGASGRWSREEGR